MLVQLYQKRDIIDTRIVEEAQHGTANFEGIYKTKNKVADESKITGIIDSQNDVGGWPELNSLPAPTDTDHDGMPDYREKRNGLNPNNAEDRNDIGKDGYTMLEIYLGTFE